jgi:ABC-type enterochelin transport system ATPase subunit
MSELHAEYCKSSNNCRDMAIISESNYSMKECKINPLVIFGKGLFGMKKGRANSEMKRDKFG